MQRSILSWISSPAVHHLPRRSTSLSLRTSKYQRGYSCSRNEFRRLMSTSPTSKVVEFKPSSTAPREVPTPLVFVSSESLEQYSSKGLNTFSLAFAEKGFACLHIDIPYEQPKGLNESAAESMDRCAAELRSRISSSNIPFPPILVARSLGCLIAQTYVSSHPVSALVLISPPPSSRALFDPSSSSLDPNPSLDSQSSSNLPRWRTSSPSTKLPCLPEFTFEPKFPVIIFALPENHEADELAAENRLVRDDGVEVISVAEEVLVGGADGQDVDIIVKLEDWLDVLGI